MAKKKESGDSSIVSVRFDQKIRYELELAARKQHRNISSYITWAVLESFKQVMVDKQTELDELMAMTWDVHEGKRLVNLAMAFPQLLTHEEEQIWVLIKSSPCFWTCWKIEKDSKHTNIQWYTSATFLNEVKLEEHWPLLKKIMIGEADENDFTERNATRVLEQKPDNTPLGNYDIKERPWH